MNLPNPNTYKNGAPAEVFHNLIEEFIHSMNAVRDYWKGVLQDLGFEYNIPEKGGVPYYTHGSFVVRVSECSSTEASLSCLIRDFSPPQLLLRKQTRDLATGDITYDTELCHVSWTAAPGDQDTLHFLRALTQPNQLPTCVGIDWASSFLEVWLKEH